MSMVDVFRTESVTHSRQQVLKEILGSSSTKNPFFGLLKVSSDDTCD